MKRQVYGFFGHMWLYPTKGLGVWFNVGKTAAAPNKVAWLIKYGQGSLGQNKTEIMDYLAETVSLYEIRDICVFVLSHAPKDLPQLGVATIVRGVCQPDVSRQMLLSLCGW